MSSVTVSTHTATDVQHSKASFGFWLYLMTDVLLFGTLFATYIVLRGNTAGNVDSKEIFGLTFVFIETIVLLTSSLFAGLALLAARSGQVVRSLVLLVTTGILGATFLSMELLEFHNLVAEGHSWTQSAFLSSYFGLVGTHGLHIFVGLIWLVASIFYIIQRGLTPRLMQRLTMWAMFWHFLDIVWICIFTIVYLWGVI